MGRWSEGMPTRHLQSAQRNSFEVKSPYSVWMQENTDQKNPNIETFHAVWSAIVYDLV